MAVLSSRAQERRSSEIRARSARERAAQSPRRFSALARLYYLARPTKIAMLRRLIITEMAVFILKTDYSCEAGYPFDDSRQVGNTS